MDRNVKIALILSAVDKMSSVVGGAASRAEKRIKSLQKGLNGFGNKAFIAGGIGTAFFTSAALDAEQYETAVSRVKQVFKSMGQDYEKATKASEDYADSLSSTVGVEREVILATQAKIATFQHVANASARATGVYNRATKAAVDMQATGFGDATNNAVQLGKALEDPIKGVNALRRSGITFNEAERAKIKNLVASGKMLKAQDMILRAVEKQVGGVAKATVNDSDKMKVAWKNTKVELGRALLPTLAKLAAKFLEVAKKVTAFIKTHPTLITNVAKGAAMLLALGAAVKIVAFVMGTVVPIIRGVGMAIKFVSATMRILNLVFSIGGGPVIWIILAIAAAVFLIIKFWKPISNFFKKLWEGIKSLFSATWKWIKNMFLNFTAIGLVIKYWKPISEFFINLWEGVKNVFSSVWKWIKGLLMKYTPFGLIYKNWGKIKTFFKDQWDGVKKNFWAFIDAIKHAPNAIADWAKEQWEGTKRNFKQFWEMIKGIPKRMYEAGKNMIKSLWEGIKSFLHKPVDAIKNMAKKIRNFLPFSPAKEGALRDIHKIKLVETIAGTIRAKPLTDAMGRVTSAVANMTGPRQVPLAAARVGGGVSVTYAPTVHVGAGGDRQSFMDLLDKHKDDLLRMVDEANRRKDRSKF